MIDTSSCARPMSSTPGGGAHPSIDRNCVAAMALPLTSSKAAVALPRVLGDAVDGGRHQKSNLAFFFTFHLPDLKSNAAVDFSGATL